MYSAPRNSRQSANANKRQSTGPRKPRHGIRLGRELADLEKQPWGGELVDVLKQLAPTDTFEEGLAYAKSGQVVDLEVHAGRLRADVQGTQRRPYRLHIDWPRWDASQWRDAISILIEQPAITSSLLTSNLPTSAATILAEKELHIVPGNEIDAFAIRCDCKAPNFCKHGVAAFLIAIERMMESPIDLLLLRGMTLDTLLERIRQHRLIRTQGRAAAHPEPRFDSLHATGRPLEDYLDRFYNMHRSPDLLSPLDSDDDSQSSQPIEHVSHALLRRLGASPLGGRFPIVGLLASVYDEVSEDLRKRLGGEG